jgi:hypothetical protein
LRSHAEILRRAIEALLSVGAVWATLQYLDLLAGLRLGYLKFGPDQFQPGTISKFLLTLMACYLAVHATVLCLPSVFPRPWSRPVKIRRWLPFALLLLAFISIFILMHLGLLRLADFR